MNSSGTLRWTFLCAAAVIGCQSMQPTVFPIESAASVDGRPLEQRPRVINGSCQAPSVPTRPEVVLDDFPDEVPTADVRAHVPCHGDAL